MALFHPQTQRHIIKGFMSHIEFKLEGTKGILSRHRSFHVCMSVHPEDPAIAQKYTISLYVCT